MTIAFFTPVPFVSTFGAAKNRIELGEALAKLGWTTCNWLRKKSKPKKYCLVAKDNVLSTTAVIQ